jgi:hypothetical protein
MRPDFPPASIRSGMGDLVSTHRRLPVLAPLILFALTVLFVIPLSAGTARAGVGGITCTISSVVTYSPGLTLIPSPQNVTFDVHYNNCVSASQPAISSANPTGSAAEQGGCLEIPPSQSGTFTITWNTRQTSTFNYHTVSAEAGGQTIYTTTATITSGVFAGDVMEEIISENTINLLDCLAPPGVTSQTGTGTLIIA